MNAIIGLPGPSITVPDTMTSTRFPLGGDSVAGLAETVIAGGIVSTSQVSPESQDLGEVA
jgi:hypothetical protein